MKKNRFRCQYQKGEICVSDTLENDTPISAAQIIHSLASLAVKVEKDVNKEIGGKVALKVLEIHEHIMKSVYENECIGNGPIKSFYLNKTAKNKKDKSERVDIECYGTFGVSDDSILDDYINKYRESKGWE